MTNTADPWGPYRATIEDHLDTCADYLGRLRRSLAGEIAPDRHYFADKAHQLHTAARRTVRITQDLDRWLGECAATTEHAEADGTRFTAECTLPAGHHGAHDHGDVPLAARHVTGELRDLADAVDRISEGFGWTARDIDRDIAGRPGPDRQPPRHIRQPGRQPRHRRPPNRPTCRRRAPRRGPCARSGPGSRIRRARWASHARPGVAVGGALTVPGEQRPPSLRRFGGSASTTRLRPPATDTCGRPAASAR